ncbi:glycoside hydrolase family 75 protein [Streptomyces sp. 6-11-2]|uniref:glycoside hydrolase family 75 protein n=1 Tax=Streptomyces sp. 6-11-2 TaxID=2585753 RepID=UPI0011425576|nr:glycoside hydrolase family 75 protein [Streptomyces sp. 6-11-2]
MRAQSLTLVAASAALLAPTTLPTLTVPSAYRTRGEPAARYADLIRAEPAAHGEGGVRAADLLARVRDCTRVSRGRYRLDAGRPATIPVCELPGAVFWKADMDIDCDGRPTVRCNRSTDPQFFPTAAYEQSNGLRLDAAQLPYVVLPAPSSIWDHRAYGVGGGSVAAVVYRDRVQYAVVGDIGPSEVIGEASYATARSLGIPADPNGGGVRSGVTYIVFEHSRISAIEDHAAAVATGERLARRLVNGGTAAAQADDPRLPPRAAPDAPHTFR